jgi:hypothetical protein
MELTDLAHRISVLERQLAAARWRGRAVCAGALLVGLVLACKSSKAADEPQTLTIGKVTIDPTGIIVASKHGSVTINELGVTIDGGQLGKIGMSPGMGVSVQTKRDGKDLIGTLGAGTLSLGGDTSQVTLMALGSASFNLRDGDYLASARASDNSAAFTVEKLKGTQLGHSASMYIGDTHATVSAKVEAMSATLFAMRGDKPEASVSANEFPKGGARLVATPGGKPELKYDK